MTEKQERQYTPDEVNEDGEYIKIGGSPVPGISLSQVLRGHTSGINRIAWSPDGRFLASSSDDKTIRIWNLENGECKAVLEHEDEVNFIAWSPNQLLLASSSGNEPYGNGALQIWNIENQNIIFAISHKFRSLAWSPDGGRLAAASNSGQIQLLDTNTWKNLGIFEGHEDFVNDIVWSPDGKDLVSASGIWHETSRDITIRIWDTIKVKQKRILSGHSRGIYSITWGPLQSLIISGSYDNSIRIWDSLTGKQIQVLELHTRPITSVSLSYNNFLLASRSQDNRVCLWRTDIWDKVAEYKEKATNKLLAGATFNPKFHSLASLGENDKVIRVWDFDYDALINNMSTIESVRYTTAKLVLVGDSGVGKTGLGWRLAHNEFKEHSSTHGQQFWVIPELGLRRANDTECEAVLWDLAGQHIYRSIHSIFLDDVNASLVLFDPTNRHEPLKGAQFWLEQLKGKSQLPPSVLVGARLDRGAPVLSQEELDQFCQEYGISGGYIGTSAKSGDGLNKLLEILRKQIPWDKITTTVTTVTFKRIKEYVLLLKEKPDRKGVLVEPADLRKQLQSTDKDWLFSDAEMLTAVGHLANLGYIINLSSSDGKQYILLAPDLLASVASSIILHADKHPRELGAINETELLQGKYPIDEFKGLEKQEQQVLLDATVVRFLVHNICFREALGSDNLLIFPSLIKQKRPLKDEILSIDDTSYTVRGRVENIYASLVVLLGYTSSFKRINRWQNQAQYETARGNMCGFRLIEDREGEIELVLYYDNGVLKEERENFQELFEQFLYQHEVEVKAFPPAICPKGHRQERATVVKRLREGKTFLHCEECGEKTNLPGIEQKPFGIGAASWLQREEAAARLRSSYEASLLRIRAYRRLSAPPRCYISNDSEHAEFAGH